MASSRYLNEEISSSLQGTAKVALNFLSFDDPDGHEDVRDLDRDNVNRLVKIFELEGCNRLDPTHSIPGSISADALKSSLQHSQLTMEDLTRAQPPALHLPSGAQIECLQGKHRVAALRGFKKLHHWWTVRLYVGLSVEAKRVLREDSNNEGRLSEGFIFFNILKHPPHSRDAARWLGRLGTKNKVDVAKRLASHKSLATALRFVLEMPGHRKSFKLSVWKRIMTEKCDEEIEHYLRLIHDTFVFIMGSGAALKFVDDDTVRNFQLRAPGVSFEDDLSVSAAVTENAVLWCLEDETERQQVLQRLRQVKYLIPTIHTLQMDVYYLRQCTGVLKRLILGKKCLPVTVQSLAWNAFRLPENSPFTPESEFLGSLKLLYLDIMQNVAELSGENPLLEDDEEKPEPRQYDEKTWIELARQAEAKGFVSDEISRLCSEDPDRRVAMKLLLAARPPSSFEWGPNFDRLVDIQVGLLKEARPIQSEIGNPELTTAHSSEPVGRRCGRQYSRAYARDRRFYTPHLFTCEVQKGSGITSLFVRRCVFHAFWGMHDISEQETFNDGMSDIAGDEQRATGPLPADQPTSAADGDYEMRDSPAFSMPAKRRRPEKTAQRTQTRVEKVKKARPKSTAVRVLESQGLVSVEGVADRSSAITAFCPQRQELGTVSEVQQNAIMRPLDRQMTILIRKGGEWREGGLHRRGSIIEGIAKVREENRGQQLFLYSREGRGLALEDCATLTDDIVCLNTETSGFPAEVEL